MYTQIDHSGVCSEALYSVDRVPPKRVAIVFGAEVYSDGKPTAILKDRLEAAASLYMDRKVEKLLMSGDNSVTGYNEPEGMKNYAIGLGVPENDIVLDFAGLRTYDTCYRAVAIFDVEDVILVSQSWHLHRAIFTCNMLGVQAVGVPSDGPRHYSLERRVYWTVREIPATAVAFWEVLVSLPLPILGNQEPIFEYPGD